LRGSFRFLFRFVLPVQFSRCRRAAPASICCRASSPAGSAIERPPVGVTLVNFWILRFLANPQNDTEMIQSERFRFAFARLQLLYRSYGFRLPFCRSLRLPSRFCFQLRFRGIPTPFSLPPTPSRAFDLGFEHLLQTFFSP